MIIVKYTTESEKEIIIEEQTKKELELIAISNVAEGNFLGFDDRTSIESKMNVKTLENKVNDIINSLDIIILKSEGVL